MNPFLTVWVKPRQTIRHIVETQPGGAAGLALIMAAFAGKFVMGAVPSAEQLGAPLLTVATVSVIAGALGGLGAWYLFGWFYRWVGSWFGGQASAAQVRAAIAWVEVPTLVLFAFWIIVFLLSPDAATILLVPSLIVWGWQTVLACHTLGEVHRFSAWKGFGTLLIPNTLIMVPVFLLSTMAAIAIPNVLRGRMLANESFAIGNLRSLVASLELYRAQHDGYPATPEVGRELAVEGFATSGPIAGHAVQGYQYTYEAPDAEHYAVVATPSEQNTGRRSFFLDETGTMRHCLWRPEGPAVSVADRSLDQAPAPCGSPMLE